MLTLYVYETISFCRMVILHYPMVDIPFPDISSSKSGSVDLFDAAKAGLYHYFKQILGRRKEMTRMQMKMMLTTMILTSILKVMITKVRSRRLRLERFRTRRVLDFLCWQSSSQR